MMRVRFCCWLSKVQVYIHRVPDQHGVVKLMFGYKVKHVACHRFVGMFLGVRAVSVIAKVLKSIKLDT